MALITVVSAAVVVVLVLGLLVGTLVARRRGYSGMGGNQIVRCSRGHLYTSIWLPGASFKAVRLVNRRYQWCPVGHHFALTAPVRDADLRSEDQQWAAAHHDLRIP